MSLLEEVGNLPIEVTGPAARHANLIFRQTGGLLEPDDLHAILKICALVQQIERRCAVRRGEGDRD